MTESLRVPRPRFDVAVEALHTAGSTMIATGNELARALPELASIRRRLDEKLPSSIVKADALAELDQARSLIVRLQKTLVERKQVVAEAWRALRRCDPDLTPDRPPSRDDMAACTNAAEAFARANAHLSGEIPRVKP